MRYNIPGKAYAESQFDGNHAGLILPDADLTPATGIHRVISVIHMSKVLAGLKQELFELTGPAVFFFVAFNIITFTKKLFLEDYRIFFSSFFVTATIGALLVGKAVILADQIPLMRRLSHIPLIYSVAWKTAIYSIIAFFIQYLEELLPHLWHDQNLLRATARMWDAIHWPHFWAVHILVCYFLLIYVSFRELARYLGEIRFLQIFFGLPRTPTPEGPET